MISFILQGSSVKGILKALSSCAPEAGIKGSEKEIVFWSMSQSKTSAVEVRLLPEAVNEEISGPDTFFEYSFLLLPALAASKVVGTREAVLFSLSSDAITLRAKGISVKITPSIETPPRPEILESKSFVKIVAGDFMNMLRISKGVLGKEGEVRISLGPEGMFIVTKGPSSVIEMRRDPEDLTEVGGEAQLRGNFLVSSLLEALKAVPKSSVIEVGISEEGILVIKFAPGAAIGEGYFFLSSLREEEEERNFAFCFAPFCRQNF